MTRRYGSRADAERRPAGPAKPPAAGKYSCPVLHKPTGPRKSVVEVDRSGRMRHGRRRSDDSKTLGQPRAWPIPRARLACGVANGRSDVAHVLVKA